MLHRVVEELRKGKDIHAIQIDAYVVSLKACTQDKGLVEDNRIHDGLVQGGLLKECSQAFMII